MEYAALLSRITARPDVLGGKPIVRAPRIPVAPLPSSFRRKPESSGLSSPPREFTWHRSSAS